MVYLIVASSFFDIKYIQYFEDNEPVEAAQFESILEPYRGRNLLFVPSADVEKIILQTYPDTIQKLQISKKFPTTLEANYSPFSQVLNLRTEKTVDGATVQKKFILNSKGFAVEADIEYPELPFMFETVEEFPEIGTQFLPEDVAEKVVKAHESFVNTLGMKIMQIAYKQDAREIHMKTEKGFMVWLDLTQDVEKQVLKLKRALPKLDIYNTSLEYVDLRISGQNSERVIYRRK